MQMIMFLPSAQQQPVDPRSFQLPIPEIFWSNEGNPNAHDIEQYFQKLFTYYRDESISSATIITEKLFWVSNNAQVYIGKSFLQAHGGLGTEFKLRIMTPRNSPNLMTKVLPRLHIVYCSGKFDQLECISTGSRTPKRVNDEILEDNSPNKRARSSSAESKTQSYLVCQPCIEKPPYFKQGTLGSVCAPRPAKELFGRKFGLNLPAHSSS